MHTAIIPYQTMTPAAFLLEGRPITVSASDRYPPTTGIKVPIAILLFLLATPSAWIPLSLEYDYAYKIVSIIQLI